ncbi:hypothetical protein HpHNI20_13420 [Helicobacter pylori]
MKDFEPLIIEHNKFIEVGGNFYCESDCSTCEYKDKCDNEVETIYVDMIPPLRSIVKAKQGQRTRYFKKIISLSVPYKDNEIEHILYHPRHKCYFCIRQCVTCQYKDECDYELMRVTDTDKIVAVDLAGQEPRSFLLTTNKTDNLEKLWFEAFSNDSIRKEQRPYATLELLFKMVRIDTSVNNLKFHKWVDNRFFYDKTDLYTLQSKVNGYCQKRDYHSLNELKAFAKDLIKSYLDYKA